MSAPRFVRGTKSRLFLYLGAVSFVGVVVYVFHGYQMQLEELRKTAEKCQQQQESLSAQLQVIFEYKLRLEKSLQQEKADHRLTREELQGRADEEKQTHEKENLESINKFTSLQQQYKFLQSQHEDLNDECNKLRLTQLQGLDERSKLQSQLQAVQQELKQVLESKEKDMESLKSQYLQLDIDNEQLLKKYKDLTNQAKHTTDQINYLQKQNTQLERELAEVKDQLHSCQTPDGVQQKEGNLARPQSSSSPQPVVVPAHDVLQEPERSSAQVSKGAAKSTTPQINPDAVLSQDKQALNVAAANVAPMPPPQQQPQQAAMDDVAQAVVPAPIWHRAQPPPGIVPAPHGFMHQVPANSPWLNRLHHEVAAAAADGPEPEGQVADSPLNQAALQEPHKFQPLGRPEARDRLEEIPRHMQHAYNQYHGDYEKEGQPEEGEEDEDDDMDQIDYGDGGKVKHAAVRPAPAEHPKGHDSVMVNPK